MNIYRLYYIHLLLFLFSLQAVYAQQQLKGVVKDEQNKPVTSANVILHQSEGAPIFSFAITNEKGEFLLKIPQNIDSVFIIITHLSYAKKEFYIRTSLPFLEVIVSEQKYELPELLIKTDPVTRRGDTLIFDVNSYRNDADQNIEQVLSKIPGITIESNGRILYDGLDISKFYIEGLDMLEGRYRIATRNLSIDAIRDIEIIEHHQPIRALDSLVRPDNAAINLRLKSNIAVTGSLRGGLGLQPALYLGDADIFGFTKKQQFNVSASANNIGENKGNNFQNLYTGFENIAVDLININKILPPFLVKENFYLDNQEFTGGYNYLRKIAAYTELKWQGFVRKDGILNIGTRSLRYNDGKNEVIFEEILNASEKPLDFNNRLIVEHNAKKIFFRANVNTELNIIKSAAENKINGTSFPESLMKHNFNGTAELTALIRRKNKAYQINSDIEYQTTDYDLNLMPVDIFTPDFPVTRFQEALQIAKQSRFKTDTYSNLFFKIKDISGQVNVGTHYNHITLNTDIITQSDTTENESLGQAFQNQNSVSELVPYINQVYKKEKNNSKWTLSLPFSASLFNINNKLNSDKSSFNILITKPKLDYYLKLPGGRYWSMGYGFEHDYNNFNTLLYEGYIIQSNRNITRSIFDINQFQRHNIYTGFSGKNIEQETEYSLSVSVSETSYDFLNSSSFNQQGLTSNLMAVKNKVSSLSSQGHLAGMIGNDIDFNIRTLYRFSQRSNIINEEKLNIKNHFITLNTQVNYTLMRSIFSIKPNFQLASNNFFETPAYQIDAELVYFIKLDRIGSFRTSYHQYFSALGERTVWNEFLAIEYKHTLKKQNIDIILNINNLTNNNYYITFIQNTFSEDFSFYRLRPRQIIFNFIKKF